MNENGQLRKCKADKRCERRCHCPLKMSFIINICLIVLIAVIVITFQLLVICETTEFETETITIDEFSGGEMNGCYMSEPFDR